MINKFFLFLRANKLLQDSELVRADEFLLAGETIYDSVLGRRGDNPRVPSAIEILHMAERLQDTGFLSNEGFRRFSELLHRSLASKYNEPESLYAENNTFAGQILYKMRLLCDNYYQDHFRTDNYGLRNTSDIEVLCNIEAFCNREVSSRSGLAQGDQVLALDELRGAFDLVHDNALVTSSGFVQFFRWLGGPRRVPGLDE